MRRRFSPFCTAFVLFCSALLFCRAALGDGLSNATVLIIRHAEKPPEGMGLTPAGEVRAKAYTQYFNPFKWQTETLKLDAIFAAADSKNSRRPRLTLEPLAQTLGLPLNLNYKDKAYQDLVNDLRTRNQAKNILVCWHHGALPELLHALGAEPNTVLPDGHWPGDEYGWVILLRFDAEGKLRDAQRVVEGF